MDNCSVLTISPKNIEIEWDGTFWQGGLASTNNLIKLVFTGPEFTVKPSADGERGIVYVNNDSSGDVEMQFNNGTPQMARLYDIAFNQKGKRSNFEVRDVLNGTVFTLGCAGLKKIPDFSIGEDGSETTVMFNFLKVAGYIPAQILQGFR